MPKYDPSTFDVENMDDAKSIILTPELGQSTETRWEKETPFIAEDIGNYFGFRPYNHPVVLDFGCGIGRLSRELVTNHDCTVLGLDISTSMRRLSLEYVDHDNYTPVSRKLFEEMVINGLKVDCCLAVWVLQHSIDVERDLRLIRRALKENGLLYIANNELSVIPTNEGWHFNGVDIRNILRQEFTDIEYSRFPCSNFPEKLPEVTFIAKIKV